MQHRVRVDGAANAVVAQSEGRTTMASMTAVTAWLRGRRLHRVILVSDPFHMFRLRLEARRTALRATIQEIGHKIERYVLIKTLVSFLTGCASLIVLTERLNATVVAKLRSWSIPVAPGWRLAASALFARNTIGVSRKRSSRYSSTNVMAASCMSNSRRGLSLVTAITGKGGLTKGTGILPITCLG